MIRMSSKQTSAIQRSFKEQKKLSAQHSQRKANGLTLLNALALSCSRFANTKQFFIAPHKLKLGESKSVFNSLRNQLRSTTDGDKTVFPRGIDKLRTLLVFIL